MASSFIIYLKENVCFLTLDFCQNKLGLYMALRKILYKCKNFVLKLVDPIQANSVWMVEHDVKNTLKILNH